MAGKYNRAKEKTGVRKAINQAQEEKQIEELDSLNEDMLLSDFPGFMELYGARPFIKTPIEEIHQRSVTIW